MHDDHRLSPEEAARLLDMRARAVEDATTLAGQAIGLDRTAIRALRFLAQRELAPRDLGDLLGLTSGGVTALIHRLERDGHVQRRPHPNDGRSNLLRISPSAFEHFSSVLQPLVDDLRRTVEGLAEDDRAAVGRFLQTAAAGARAQADALAAAARETDRDEAAPLPGLWC